MYLYIYIYKSLILVIYHVNQANILISYHIYGTFIFIHLYVMYTCNILFIYCIYTCITSFISSMCIYIISFLCDINLCIDIWHILIHYHLAYTLESYHFLARVTCDINLPVVPYLVKTINIQLLHSHFLKNNILKTIVIFCVCFYACHIYVVGVTMI